MIHQTIKEKIKDAMRAKDALQVEVLRGLNAIFTNEMIAKSVTTEFLDDESVLVIIKRAVKQRKDSIDQFTKGNRADLADKEKAELSILESYLPQMMSKDEIKKVAEKKKLELGITDKTKLGIFVGTVMKELKGKADGADVKEVVESLFT